MARLGSPRADAGACWRSEVTVASPPAPPSVENRVEATAAARSAPLAGIRVIDLTRLLPGPLCGQHLRHLGADVIKVEDTAAGDYARPGMRELVNRGKRSMRLDLKREEGKAVLRRLCSGAHVLIESFRPGVMDRLGVGYENLRTCNERLVYCAITGYGQDGARSAAAGHDINYLAVTGVLDRARDADDMPMLPGFQIADLLGGTMSATAAILAGLVEVRGGGAGRRIDISMTDALLAHSVLAVMEVNESAPQLHGGATMTTGATARYNVYRTKDDRFLAVGAQEKKFWDRFCDVIGLAQLKDQHAAIGEPAEPVKEAVARAVRGATLEDWSKRFANEDCCVSPVRTTREALSDPELRRRGAVAVDGDRFCLGPPWKFFGHTPDLTARSPQPGEHTDAVLSGIGYSASEIDALRATGIVKA